MLALWLEFLDLERRLLHRREQQELWHFLFCRVFLFILCLIELFKNGRNDTTVFVIFSEILNKSKKTLLLLLLLFLLCSKAERQKEQNEQKNKWQVCYCWFTIHWLHYPNWISPMRNSSCFPWGKPAVTELCYPFYGACCLFECLWNPPNSDMDHRIFYMRADVSACNCTRGCTDIVGEFALKVDWEKSFAALANRTCVSDVLVRRSTNWATSSPPQKNFRLAF